MSGLPRLKINEFLLETDLISRRHILVEGPADARFFRAWAKDIVAGERVVVTSVDTIEIDPQWLFDIGLNDGNRAMVVYVARVAHQQSANLRGVADRDCGHDINEHSYSTLAWTDFPALESYSLEEACLDRANLLSYREGLPPASSLLPNLAFALSELFAVRKHNEHLPKPKYQAGIKDKDNPLLSFDVTATIDARIRGDVASYARPPSDADPRSYAYGHDVAELLLAAYGNKLKNQAGLRNREAVEGTLYNAIQVVGTYKEEALFKSLANWVAN